MRVSSIGVLVSRARGSAPGRRALEALDVPGGNQAVHDAGGHRDDAVAVPDGRTL